MDENVKDQLYSEKFREQLEKGMAFPGYYPFKFIVKADTDARGKIEAVFEGTGANIAAAPSSKGNYVSLTITMKASSPDDIIEKYTKVADIPDVIKL